LSWKKRILIFLPGNFLYLKSNIEIKGIVRSPVAPPGKLAEESIFLLELN